MDKDLRDLTNRMETNAQARLFLKSKKRNLARLASGPSFVPEWDAELDRYEKAAVGAMSVGNDTALQRLNGRAYFDIALKRTLLRQMTGMLPVPPLTSVGSLRGTLPVGTWKTEGGAYPAARVNIQQQRTEVTSFGFILPFSKELAQATDDRALSTFERLLTRALVHTEDLLLLDDNAAVDQTSPEGLLYGVGDSGGGSPSVLDDAISAMWHNVSSGDPISPYFVASARGALYLSLLREEGTPRFPNISLVGGGNISGVPLLISQAAGNRLILVDAARLAVADEGVEAEGSKYAAVQLDDAPTMNSTTPTPAQAVSAFGTNFVFLKVVRYLHWSRLADDCVGYVTLPVLDGSPV